MDVKRLALVLVDISGYTRFVKMHTMSLLPAERKAPRGRSHRAPR